MKKIKLLALTVGLLTAMGLLSACTTDTGTETGTEAASTTASETDSVSAGASTADPDAETDSETPTETIPPVETNPEEVAAMEAMLSADYKGAELPIGGWATPASALREVYSGEAGTYDKAFQLLADAGLNYMITLEEWSSGSWPLESLSSANKAGIKLWYNCAAQSADYSMEKINAMLASGDAAALSAIYVKDEPTMGQIEETAALMAAIREALGTDNKLPVMSNLLPTYASSDMVSRDYRSYVRTYLDAAKPDRLMFDYYPFGASGDTLPAMMANIAIAREEAAKDGIELYTFLQSSGQPTMREPSVEELRINAHINLAMGVKGVAYFLACEHYEGWEYSAMLNYKGETTPLYDKIKKVNTELAGFKGSFLGFESKGILLATYDKGVAMLEKYNCSTLLDSFGSIKEIQTANRTGALVGCFEDADGREAYYLVNTEYTRPNKVTLTLDRAQSYIVWTKSGAEKIENTDTLELVLEKGGAAFVVKFDVNQY